MLICRPLLNCNYPILDFIRNNHTGLKFHYISTLVSPHKQKNGMATQRNLFTKDRLQGKEFYNVEV
jgi:hypothetical protein